LLVGFQFFAAAVTVTPAGRLGLVSAPVRINVQL
jgi:hypothetical protein